MRLFILHQGQQAQFDGRRVAAGHAENSSVLHLLAHGLGLTIDRFFQQVRTSMIKLVPGLEFVRITQAEVSRKINDLDAGSGQFSSHAHCHSVRRCKKHHVASVEFGFFGCRKNQIIHKAPKRRIHGRHIGSRILARRDGANFNVRMATQQTQQLHPGVARSSHDTGLDFLFLHVETPRRFFCCDVFGKKKPFRQRA